MPKSHSELASGLTLRCVVLTCSDTRTPATDGSGNYILSQLETEGHVLVRYAVIPDDAHAIRQELQDLSGLDVVLINGGTGIASRDNTFDAVSGLIQKSMPGFGEIFRVLSYEEIGAAAMLSRATAGVIDGTLVFSMPGSTAAVRLAMQKLILPDLKHLVWEIRKGA